MTTTVGTLLNTCHYSYYAKKKLAMPGRGIARKLIMYVNRATVLHVYALLFCESQLFKCALQVRTSLSRQMQGLHAFRSFPISTYTKQR